MTDNELTGAIRSVLLAHLSAQNLPGVRVLGNYQPTQQGRVSETVVYFNRIMEPRYGWQSRERNYNQLTGKFDYIESQWYTSTFQFMALAPQDPNNLALPTPNDLLSMSALILNSRVAINDLRKLGVGVERITQQRVPYFVNDKDQFEASPSFDFTVSHKRSIIQQTPAVDAIEANIYRV